MFRPILATATEAGVGMPLLAALLLALVPNTIRAQQPSPPNGASSDTVWDGQYACADGRSDLQLKIQTRPDGAADAVLEVHPIYGRGYRPAVALQMRGFLRQPDGFLILNPVRWLSQPYGSPFSLTGIVSGDTYRGGIIGGNNCSGFIATERSGTTASYSQPPPASAARIVPPHVDHWRPTAILWTAEHPR